MREDFRHQHLHEPLPPIRGIPTELSALIEECIFKAPSARPRPANALARLQRMTSSPGGAGLAKLRTAHLAEVGRQAEEARMKSLKASEAEARKLLLEAAGRLLERIRVTLVKHIQEAAPSAKVTEKRRQYTNDPKVMQISLGLGTLVLEGYTDPEQKYNRAYRWSETLPFSVIAFGSISVTQTAKPRHPLEYWSGRSHSLWFADAQLAGHFGWFETAFCRKPEAKEDSYFNFNPVAAHEMEPHSLDPSSFPSPTNTFTALAWPFTELSGEGLEWFVDRWAGYLALASEGELVAPATVPEVDPSGSWRR